MRRLAFIPRGLMRTFLAGVALGPLAACYQLEQEHPEYLQNPYWIGGAVAGLLFLIFMLRVFGEGRGILRGLILAVISVGFVNGLVFTAIGGAYLLKAGIDSEILVMAVIAALVALVCGFILQRMERYRYG